MRKSLAHRIIATIPTLSLFALLALNAVAATAETLAGALIPSGDTVSAREIRLTFTEPQTPDDAKPPVTLSCTPAAPKGSGHWTSSTEWTFNFEKQLPKGTTCKATTPSGEQLGAFMVVGQKEVDLCDPFGPTVVDTQFAAPAKYIPDSEAKRISETPTLLLNFSCPVDTKSLEDHVVVTIDGMPDPIKVDVLQGTEREKAICAVPATCGKPGAEAVRPRLTLPSRKSGAFRLKEGIRSKTGFGGSDPRTIEFEVRPPFEARLRCDETYADGSCNPYLPIYLSFTEEAELSRYGRPPLKSLTSEESRDSNEYSAQQNRLLGHYYTFNAPFAVNSEYELELSAALTDSTGRELPEQMRKLRVKTGPIPGLAKFQAPFGILEGGTDAKLPISLRRTEESLPVSIFSLEAGATPAIGSINQNIVDLVQVLRNLNLRHTKTKYLTESVAGLIHDSYRKTETSVRRNIGPDGYEMLGIDLPKKGFHVVEASSQRLSQQLQATTPPAFVSTGVLRTNIALHAKLGADRSLVWATYLDSGTPASGVDVSVYNCDGRALAVTRTDSQGFAWISSKLEPAPSPYECFRGNEYVESQERFNPQFIVTAQTADDFSFLLSSWNTGLESWRFGINEGDYTFSDDAFHTVLSRSLLKRGETVRMKHIARRRSMQGFDFVDPKKLPTKVIVRHQGSDEKYEASLVWDEAGIAVSDINLPAHAKLGQYDIGLAKQGGDYANFYTGYFSVEDYRLPTLRGYIRPLPSENGTPLVDVGVSFLAGGPAGKLPVKLRYNLEQYQFTFPGIYTDFRFGDEAISLLNNRPSEEREDGYGSSYQYASTPKVVTKSIELNDAGAARVELDGLPAPTRPSRLRVNAEYRDPAGAFQSSEQVIPALPGKYHVGIKLDSWATVKDGFEFDVAVLKPDGSPVKGVAVLVESFQRDVFTHRKKLIGGTYAYENVVYDKPLSSEIPSNLCRVTTDARGIARCKARFSAAGNIILQATVEDGTGKSQTASSVWVANGDEWWFAQTDNDRIDFIPEKTHFEPGDVARFQVRMPFRHATALITVEREGVMDAKVVEVSRANPIVELPILERYGPNVVVSALVLRGRNDEIQPLGMIDFGKPTVKLGMVNIRVGEKGYELRVDVKTDRQVYQVREKVRADIRVQTADGAAPSVRGLKDAEVAVAVIDEALLELKRNDSWAILSAMTGERSSTVQTSTSGLYVIGKRHFGQKALPFGGGGGLARTREILDPEVYWSARVPLDRDGKATVEFPLKDSISSFKVVAVATAGSYLFGTGSASIRATQDIVVVSANPPIARVGDRFPAEWTVRNTSEKALDVRLSGSIAGNTWKREIKNTSVNIPAGGSHTVREEIEIPDLTSLAYVFNASAGAGQADSLKTTQNVLPRLETTVQNAVLKQVLKAGEVLTEGVYVPETALPNTAKVKVALSKSLVDSLATVRDYMLRYPYNCLEQQVSRAVALNDSALWNGLRQSAAAYFAPDGYFCYFPGCKQGSATLTSYVLRVAHEQGWKLAEADEARALDALTKLVEGRDSALQDQIGGWEDSGSHIRALKVSAVDAISRYRPASAKLFMPLWPDLNTYQDLGIVQLYRTALLLSDLPKKEERMAELRNVLATRIRTSGTAVRLRGEGLSWYMEDSASITAQLLLAATADVNHPLRKESPRIVTSLLEMQQNGRWRLTTANALGTVALRKFASEFEKMPVTGSSKVQIAAFSADVSWEGAQKHEVASSVRSGRSDVTVTQDGTGQPWANVSTYAAVPLTEPKVHGFSATRTVRALEQKDPAKWSVGDLVEVTVTGTADAQYNWVVINDPIPAGASVVRGTSDEQAQNWISFEEKLYDSYRAYFQEVSSGTFRATYVMRLNSTGAYNLPNSRVEALYAPESFAELPLKPFVIE